MFDAELWYAWEACATASQSMRGAKYRVSPWVLRPGIGLRSLRCSCVMRCLKSA